MNEKSEQIAKALILMFNVFKEEPSKEVLSVYIKLLLPYEISEIKQSISNAVAESEFCPKPATILKHLKPSEHDLKAHANNELARVIQSVRRGDVECLKGDRLTTYLLSSRWNLKRLQEDMLENDFKWFQKEFVEAYINYSQSPRMLETVIQSNGLLNSPTKGLVENLAKKLTVVKS